MDAAAALDSIRYITLPPGFALSSAAMRIDPSIPLPAQTKGGDPNAPFKISELTPEQILAGILTVMARDRANEHIDYYRSIITKARPEIKKELSAAAVVKAKNHDWEMAEEIFAALRVLDPNDMAIVLNNALFLDERATSCRESSMDEDADALDSAAEALYKRAMDADDAPRDAFFNAGFFYMKKREFAKAKGCFETYVALTCDESDEDLGENGVYKKERAQEILNYIDSQSIDDERFARASHLVSIGREEEGAEEIRKFIQSNPDVWNAWFILGWAMRRMGRWGDALKAFERSTECPMGDENADTFNEMAICAMETGDAARAKSLLKKALALAPENVKIVSNMGCLALKEGNESEARKYFEAALVYDPRDKIARAELERMGAL